MNKLLFALSILAIATAPMALAETYGPVVGASVNGSGASSGANQARLTAPTSFTSVTVTVVDDVAGQFGMRTFFSVCVERAGVPNLCSRADGDLQASGLGTVTLENAEALPAGTPIAVFVYTIYVGADGEAAIGTTGTVSATYS